MAVLQNFYNSINNKYQVSARLTQAKNLLKTSDISTAVVNILGATGIAGFKFHIPETEQIKMQAEATDHYIDTNSAIQDHIIIKPIEITLTGLVGDYFYSVNKIEDMLATITPTIALVKEFLPKLSNAAMQIKGLKKTTTYKYDAKTGTVTGGVSASRFNLMDMFSLFQELYKMKSAQTRAFFFFECLWKARAPFSVETTWKRYDNMIITSIQPLRDQQADITSFTVTFKQLSFAETKTETVEQYAERMKAQASKTVDKGVDKGELVDTIPSEGLKEDV